jgi:alpha-beta hydrolase superfamily lysophospholipase
MGGSLAAGLVCRARADIDAFLLVAPTLNLHSRLEEAEKRRLLADDSSVPVPAGIRDEDYTDDPAYLRFMKEDALMGRLVSPRHRAAQVRLDDFCRAHDGDHPRHPAALFLPTEDPIIDLQGARARFNQLSHANGVVIEFPLRTHFLEFSRWRGALVELFATFARAGGLGPI